MTRRGEQTVRVWGVCVPALDPRCGWEGSLSKGQDFQPDLGNPAVRNDRGASENVAMAELSTHLATERARLVTLRLQQTRPTSIPTKALRVFHASNGFRSLIFRQRPLPSLPHLHPVWKHGWAWADAGSWQQSSPCP